MPAFMLTSSLISLSRHSCIVSFSSISPQEIPNNLQVFLLVYVVSGVPSHRIVLLLQQPFWYPSLCLFSGLSSSQCVKIYWSYVVFFSVLFGRINAIKKWIFVIVHAFIVVKMYSNKKIYICRKNIGDSGWKVNRVNG